MIFDKVIRDTVIRAEYEKIATYSITVNKGTVEGQPNGEYEVNTAVTVSANSAPSGKRFSHWEDENGTMVSTNASYRLSLYRNITLTAVYSDKPVEKKPFITCETALDVSGKIGFAAQKNMVSGYKFIECGVVIKKSNTPITNLTLLTSGITKGKSSSQNKFGQFRINKGKVAAGDTYYGVAYLIYKDAYGNIFTTYSNVVNATR